MSVFLGVINEGLEQGVLTNAVDKIAISDFIWGVVNRSIAMWLVRGRAGSLTARAPELFDMIWRAIASDDVLVAQLTRDRYSDADTTESISG